MWRSEKDNIAVPKIYCARVFKRQVNVTSQAWKQVINAHTGLGPRC
jgi:hypothetical protein